MYKAWSTCARGDSRERKTVTPATPSLIPTASLPGTLFVISAPSGAGKTSLVKRLLESDRALEVSVSHTTRPARPGEVDGTHYHFVAQSEFERMRSDNAFLEHAQVFDNCYGTALDNVVQPLESGRDIVLEIDWQGARQVRERLPECISIFILPPTREALEERLRGRGQDADSVIAKRMAQAVDEMSHYDEFEYLVINDDFDTALADLLTIVRARRLSLSCQRTTQSALLAALVGER